MARESKREWACVRGTKRCVCSGRVWWRKLSLSHGDEGRVLGNQNSPIVEGREFIGYSLSKEQLPDVVSDQAGGVIDPQAAKSGNTVHGVAEKVM